ncbi:MAG: glycoside hydrolase family 127 protein [Halanaerobiales bacterium]|nr:glycoside hydrolase family 127 protein [Halanaerobiales bacterium]
MKINNYNNKSDVKNTNKLKAISVKDIKFNAGFWAEKLQLVKDVVIPYQWQALNDQVPGVEPSHTVEHFRIAAGEIDREYQGRVYQDSDLAKWLEAASYSLAYNKNPELEEITEKLIELIEKSQEADGYLDTYYTVVEPEKKWTNVRDRHEMYCAGHMIEAAVAHYESTGKRKLLDMACKLADHIDSKFGSDKGKVRGYPGHQEIELALIRLYRATGDEKYFNLSKFFIEERGQKPHFFDQEAQKRGEKEKKHYRNIFDYQYSQSHLPVREQKVAIGHAVRAMYFYAGLTDIAIETGDSELIKVAKRLWENVTGRQMYITGGVGAEDNGEAFSFDYDLPNDRAYTETCAAIGLVFWAQRMLRLELDGKYADIMEKALYNGVMSGISLDGEKYFYVNPLEVWPAATKKRYDLRHVEYTRQQWFGCACCPPNIARLIASIGQYVYFHNNKEIYLSLYTDSDAKFAINDRNVFIKQKTNYPWDENVTIIINTEESLEFSLGLRIPGWCNQAGLKINDQEINLSDITEKGYAIINRKWNNGDQLVLHLPMSVERIKSHPQLRYNIGKVTIQRGPVVYCLEEIDNGSNLFDLKLPSNNKLIAEYDQELLGGITIIRGTALRTDKESWDSKLYQSGQEKMLTVPIMLIPYYAWSNRESGEMLVWIKEKEL